MPKKGRTSEGGPGYIRQVVVRSFFFWSLYVIGLFQISKIVLDNHFALELPQDSASLLLQQESNAPTPPRRSFLPLDELVGSFRLDDEQAKQACKAESGDGVGGGGEDLIYVKDTVLDPALAFEGGRKIPRIVHLTSKSRCNVPLFARNIDTWRLANHSVFLHDDEAIERLFQRDWPEFPMLHKILKCLPAKGAVMTDVWRILAIWEYGGIYADFDASPNKFDANTITPEDDAFFVVETLYVTNKKYFVEYWRRMENSY